ncbi:MAG: hypothetical protein QHJ73_05920, partial [Armatimonadota bacterium]|nr:hypothetical protein [Armatimonadota bacterium]
MLNVALFWEEAFPAIHTHRVTLAGIRRALEGFQVRPVGAAELHTVMGAHLLVMPFGSAFPKPAWPSILHYLQAGGNLLNLGGVPFAVPCVRGHAVWRDQVLQSAYHRSLGVERVFLVKGDAICAVQAPAETPLLADLGQAVAGKD